MWWYSGREPASTWYSKIDVKSNVYSPNDRSIHFNRNYIEFVTLGSAGWNGWERQRKRKEWYNYVFVRINAGIIRKITHTPIGVLELECGYKEQSVNDRIADKIINEELNEAEAKDKTILLLLWFPILNVRYEFDFVKCVTRFEWIFN